jgi:hypothetical protein
MLAAATPEAAGAGGARAAADDRGERRRRACRSAARRRRGGGGARAAVGAAASAPASRWKASLAALSIRAGQLDWRDATTAPEAALALGEFSVRRAGDRWPLDAPVVFKGAGVLGSAEERGKLAFSARATPRREGRHPLDAMPLGRRGRTCAAPRAAARRRLSADLTVEWKAGDGAPLPGRRAPRRARRLRRSATPRRPSSPPKSIELRDARVDTVAPHRALGTLRLRRRGCASSAARTAAWNFARWARRRVVAGAGAVASPRAVGRARPAAGRRGSPPWRRRLGDSRSTRAASASRPPLACPGASTSTDSPPRSRASRSTPTAPAPFRLRMKVAVPAVRAAAPSARASSAASTRAAS